jgi:hypothetical protein
MDEDDLDILFQVQSLLEVSLLESDHDLDGDVDGRDFLIWQRYHGGETGNGDANSDLSVDGDDLAVWQMQYGSSVPAVSMVATVPEPGISLAVVGYMLYICGRLARSRD